MKYILTYLTTISVIIFFAACSEVKDDIVPLESQGVHGTGVLNPESANYHGTLLIDQSFNDCAQCHATDLSGGLAKVGCVECHSSINVHQEGINDPSSDNFHGNFIGGKADSWDECLDCHGENFDGGVASPNCTTCHNSITVHKEGIVNSSSDSFHGKFLLNNSWNLSGCKSCHGSTYSGGIASPTCNNCHSQPDGPEACNTCHGDFNDADKIAPPNSIAGSSSTSDRGVGAHDTHLFNAAIANVAACEECHVVPAELNSDGHLDSDGMAEVDFSGSIFSSPSAPSYSATSLQCSNTYCHGNFVFSKEESDYPTIYTEDQIAGNNFSLTWNNVGQGEAECGSCHNLPPTGHTSYSIEKCVFCHGGVVDSEGNIIDPAKHINDEKNVFGN
ncbi:MAG: CxxxxCH/CxxCH domain-containing protein [Ignavibacteria bacterium]|jgi:hypothetical protein